MTLLVYSPFAQRLLILMGVGVVDMKSQPSFDESYAGAVADLSAVNFKRVSRLPEALSLTHRGLSQRRRQATRTGVRLAL
jgi:hypothetical protein